MSYPKYKYCATQKSGINKGQEFTFYLPSLSPSDAHDWVISHLDTSEMWNVHLLGVKLVKGGQLIKMPEIKIESPCDHTVGIDYNQFDCSSANLTFMYASDWNLPLEDCDETVAFKFCPDCGEALL